MKPYCPDTRLAVCKGPALFSFSWWEGYSLTLPYTHAHTPFSKFAMSPPPLSCMVAAFVHVICLPSCVCTKWFIEPTRNQDGSLLICSYTFPDDALSGQGSCTAGGII